MKKPYALAVRPYGERLRPKVFAFLERMGLEVEAPPQLGASVSNEDVVRYLAGQRADLLVVPFHVVRGTDGERTNGLELLTQVRQSIRWTNHVPTLMPVSLFVGVAFGYHWRANRLPGVLPLFEGDIGAPATATAFRRFLESEGGWWPEPVAALLSA